MCISRFYPRISGTGLATSFSNAAELSVNCGSILITAFEGSDNIVILPLPRFKVKGEIW